MIQSAQLMVALWLGAFVSVATVCVAQNTGSKGSFEKSWESLRQRQPKGLSLEINLAKTTFHLGEIIQATLLFRNASEATFHLWTGTGDRSGRIADIAFRAADENGNRVADPLEWYFGAGFSMGGLGGDQDLGQWSIGLTGNQWLRFDKPGRYRMYAWSSRAQDGKIHQAAPQPKSVELVSEIVTIEITSLTEELEKEIIAQAELDLGRSDAAGSPVERLRYLGTARSRASLMRLLDGPHHYQAMLGLMASPNPPAEAEALLAEVARPETSVTTTWFDTYAYLRRFSRRSSGASEEERRKLGQAEQEDRAVIIHKTKAALANKQGKAFVTTLMALFFLNPKDTELRATLLKRREELSSEQIESLLHSWDRVSGSDLLPFLRHAVQPPHNSALALGRLSQLAPDEAKKIILEDIAQEKSRFLRPCCDQFDVLEMLKLPDRGLPEVDSIFRKQLEASKSRAYAMMPLVTRYATTNLLPDVAAVYQRAEGRWACRFQNDALKYWIRCDPKAGVEALGRALAAREKTGCYRRTMYEVLLDHWTDEALPLVVSALQDENAEVVQSATEVLARHGSSEQVSNILAAIERLNNSKIEQYGRWPGDAPAAALVQSKRWKLTPEQTEKLLSLVHPNSVPRLKMSLGMHLPSKPVE